MLEQKIRDVFNDVVVLKDPKRAEFFSNLSLPSYMRDWLVMKFATQDGGIDYDNVLRYIHQFIPNREGFELLKYDMVKGDFVKFLARIRVNVNIKDGRVMFELPDFGGTRTGAGGIVEESVLDKWRDALLKESENWGIIELMWLSSIDGKKDKGTLQLIDYKPFCPYKVDLDFFRESRAQFNTQEWIDILISAADYNPAGYKDEQIKLVFLRRLLPFVERRINLIELAPKGTGKSYVYEKISKRGWLVTGGTISRATLIYDNNKKMGGLITRFDYVGFDESQSISFEQPNQIQAALKHYMEFGELKGFDAQMAADAGIIVLGNIDADRFDINKNMVAEINKVFQESATLDRFHGFIPGWEIPRLTQDMIAYGWALNTEYFAEVLHELRQELIYATIVDDALDIPAKADKRDLTAIKRICTAFLKLIFPHASKKQDIPSEEFVKYCLQPALEMRGIIKKQLAIVDPKEFGAPPKCEIPDIRCNY